MKKKCHGNPIHYFFSVNFIKRTSTLRLNLTMFESWHNKTETKNVKGCKNGGVYRL